MTFARIHHLSLHLHYHSEHIWTPQHLICICPGHQHLLSTCPVPQHLPGTYRCQAPVLTPLTTAQHNKKREDKSTVQCLCEKNTTHHLFTRNIIDLPPTLICTNRVWLHALPHHFPVSYYYVTLFCWCTGVDCLYKLRCFGNCVLMDRDDFSIAISSLGIS